MLRGSGTSGMADTTKNYLVLTEVNFFSLASLLRKVKTLHRKTGRAETNSVSASVQSFLYRS